MAYPFWKCFQNGSWQRFLFLVFCENGLVSMVWFLSNDPHSQFELLISPYSGDTCWDEVFWWTICYKDPEEGCGHPGWWCRMHHGGKTSSSSAGQTSIPHLSPLLLSDCGENLFLELLFMHLVEYLVHIVVFWNSLQSCKGYLLWILYFLCYIRIYI